jgi:hypothetical protein
MNASKMRPRRFQPAVTQTVKRKRQLSENSRGDGSRLTLASQKRRIYIFSSIKTTSKRCQ